MRFREGDRVRVSRQHCGGPEIGRTATISKGNYAMHGEHDFVDVRWDGGYAPGGGVAGWYASRFELIEPKAMAVDELINRYAADLRKNIDNGTMVAPYSEIGIFANFLMDYKRLGE